MKTLRVLFLLVATVLTSSCQTGGVILRETPLNASETRRAVVAVIGEPRNISVNGRELSSAYYDRKNNKIEKMNMARERYYTHVTILGDRRPYDIRVDVVVEGLNELGKFEMMNRDDERATLIAEKIRQALHQGRDNRNVIDDFRSF